MNWAIFRPTRNGGLRVVPDSVRRYKFDAIRDFIFSADCLKLPSQTDAAISFAWTRLLQQGFRCMRTKRKAV